MKKIQRVIAGKEGNRPVSSILNNAFRYEPSHKTNVAETFARIRAERETALNRISRIPTKARA